MYGGIAMQNFTCIVCPNGCSLTVEKLENTWHVNGNKCKRGIDFAISEITDPKRSLCTTVKTTFKKLPRLPVRTDGEIPLKDVFAAMQVLNKIKIERLYHSGEVVVSNILDTGVNVISTSDMYYFLEEES